MILNNILNLFFPKLCGACSKPIINCADELCLNCEIHLVYESNPNTTKIIKDLRGRVQIEKGVFFIDFTKKEGVQQVLHSIKYQNQKKLAIYLAEELANKLGAEFFETIDVLIPVPLHPNKFKIRGFNQADLIATGIHNSFKIPIDTQSLQRKVFTESQTKKNRLERWKNVQNAFYVSDKNSLNKKHILLLDDVFTTGATLEACIKTLQKEVDCKCSILTLARA
jgi:ComF family protein